MSRQLWSSLRSHGFGVLGAALTLAWVLVLAGFETPTATVRAAQPSAGPGPELFAKMMPVFSSPRCLGCHGKVDPAAKDTNHEGGTVDVALDDDGDMAKDTKEAKACLECHTTANQWRTAPKVLSFVGKAAPALCWQIKRLNKLSSTNAAAQGKFLAHVTTDYFIGLAFVGKGGVGDDSPFGPIAADPPAMDRPQFVGAAKRWLQEGQASCGSAWNGTVSKETTWPNVDAITQGGTIRERMSLKFQNVAVTVVDNVATADMSYHSEWEANDPRGRSCRDSQLTEHASNEDPIPTEVFLINVMDNGNYFVTFSVGAIDGVRTKVDKYFPVCKEIKVETPYKQPGTGGDIRGSVDPKDPTHLVGEKPVTEPDGSKTLYKWDFTLTKG